MLLHEPLCCEAYAVPSESLECCDTEPCGCHSFHAWLDENHQNVRFSEAHHRPDSEASNGGALSGLESQMDHGILQCIRFATVLGSISALADNFTANALGIFSPAITLVIFAIISGARGQKLDTETAFTTIAILSMVTHPANMVMTIVPRVVGSFASFERIQSFLLRPVLHDDRGNLPKVIHGSQELVPGLTSPDPAIVLHQVRIGHKQPILDNLNLKVAPGSTTIISGPVGSGKTTLLRTILGEIKLAHGLVKISTREVAYCAQRPWLPSGTIREVIHGMSDRIDNKWYDEVTRICCFTHDFDSLPEGDETEIGSRGLNLSGGQRQRVVGHCIALYAVNSQC